MKSSIELIRLFAVILIVFTHTRNDLESGTFYFFIEELPTFGTAILSIISGYLYYTVSRTKSDLFKKKIKSLAIPYLFANISVLFLVLFFNYILGYNALNRLDFNFELISNGVFALNAEPINPPTYFVRDIFLMFSFIALITQKEWRALLVLIPFIYFGKFILRYDVAILFLLGILYARFHMRVSKNSLLVLLGVVSVLVGIWAVEYLKYPVAFFFFILFLDIPFRLYKTGRFSYLLHLYHAPLIVILYPILEKWIFNPYLLIFAQIFLSIFIVYLFYLVTKSNSKFKILSGGR